MLIICFLLNFFFTSNSFQTSFFQEINKQYANKNLYVSLLSAYQVLGLTANGAVGKTLQDMLIALGNTSLEELNNINKNILDISKKFSTIEIANAIMTFYRPKQGFMDAASIYEATVEPLRNAQQINNWCNLKTHGKIQKILEQIPANTVMILLNAIYFKGKWKTKFDEKKTKKKAFYNLNSKSKGVLVDTMYLEKKFNYYEDKEVQIIELPYKQDSMSAVILLPNEDLNINNFITGLNDEKLQRLIKRMSTQKVKLELPKFTLDFSSSLNEALKKMGMVEPFKGYADFTGILDGGGIYISDVFQKSYLSVDEKGTEAAASTSVTVIKKSIQRFYSMFINRPFLFMLRNEDLPQGYEMLFMAKVEKL